MPRPGAPGRSLSSNPRTASKVMQRSHVEFIRQVFRLEGFQDGWVVRRNPGRASKVMHFVDEGPDSIDFPFPPEHVCRPAVKGDRDRLVAHRRFGALVCALDERIGGTGQLLVEMPGCCQADPLNAASGFADLGELACHVVVEACLPVSMPAPRSPAAALRCARR